MVRESARKRVRGREPGGGSGEGERRGGHTWAVSPAAPAQPTTRTAVACKGAVMAAPSLTSRITNLST